MNTPAREVKLPETDDELRDRIRFFVADALDKPVEAVGFDDNLYSSLGLDSLGAVSIFIDMSYEFGLPEPARNLAFSEFHTINLLVTYARSFDRN